jgi:N-acetylglutamate synthase-like GNAT family acetyltransferase
VVTDLATYGYVTDVVIVEDRRGKGLGEWMVECILAHPDLQRLRRLALLTRDAPDLYARFGFTAGPVSLGYMELPGGGSAAVRRAGGGASRD